MELARALPCISRIFVITQFEQSTYLFFYYLPHPLINQPIFFGEWAPNLGPLGREQWMRGDDAEWGYTCLFLGVYFSLFGGIGLLHTYVPLRRAREKKIKKKKMNECRHARLFPFCEVDPRGDFLFV